MRISHIFSRQILDSRGHPTLETTVELDIGVSGRAAVPSGASTGSHEAVELRDQNPKVYQGLGVTQAIANVTGPIAKAVINQDVRQQQAIDELLINLDGTVNKSKLGANAILSVSLAIARARAAMNRLPLYRSLAETFELPPATSKTLPRPMMNVINGGLHADTDLPVQEFMIIPNGLTFADRLERGTMVFHELAELLKAKHLRTTVGDEGGYAPAITDPTVALDFLTKAIGGAELDAPKDMALGLDVAATHLYNPGAKRYALGETKGGLAVNGLVGLYTDWLKKYPIISLEDPLAEDDWEGWQELMAKLGTKIMIVGDDLFVTQVDRLTRGIEATAANAILIKPNQVGTVTETINTIIRAQAAKFTVIVSHRSGETNDDFIADLAVAVKAPYLKAGAPCRGERLAKYNRLLAIEQELIA